MKATFAFRPRETAPRRRDVDTRTHRALLAIMKAGGAYLPLDTAFPADRLAFMLKDSRAPVVLTRGELLDRLPDQNRARVVCLDRDEPRISAASWTNCWRNARR